ncbi:hypothetical protein LAZ67_13001422 [Cordylochernes scorpioides]|uniref:Uncharacterized protein n=1 Tax=Cordylochernes scorpioides TaxID=51811 RepID=A0ABY6L3U2_9ARAC|nr:hypothetical protein LAZ67_13001422 [Cordylochernes scorpioides]
MSPASCELRSVIRFLAAKKNSAKDIHTELCQVYGEGCMSSGMVRRWVREFENGRTGVHDEPRAGRPSVSNETIAKVEAAMLEDRREFSRKVGISVFCSEVKDKIICLICNNAISVPKLYNIKRHYEQHKSKYDTYEGLMRQEKLKEFKLGMKKQQFMFTKVSQESEAAVHASYVLSEMIAKHSKPFTEGDFIKECLIKAAEIVCPGSVKTFQAISLSRNTVVEGVTDMARNLNDQIKEKSSCFEAFSIACDESTDMVAEKRCQISGRKY